MGWLTDIFAPKTASSSRKGQALSSTHEAFSLPTSSPGLGSRMHDGRYGTPEPPDSATSYTYPPPSSARGSYDYVPSPTNARSRQGSLLPMHNNAFSPQSQHPSLAQTWARLRVWLGNEYPELGDTLNYGILPHDLAEIEMQLGVELPSAVRESYLQVDGQEPESSAGCSAGLFFGLTLLPLTDVLDEWRFWREVDDDPQTGANARLRDGMRAMPPNWVRREYSCRGWIPLASDKGGNYLGVDLSPGEGGAVGQVIIFGRDVDTKVVMWRGDGTNGWAKWLASFVEELESGEGIELGSSDRDGSEDEDDIGYDSYFYDGTGRGQGDAGGDSGLRLGGEYRGWSILDALADRSIRRWYAAGVIPDASAATAEGSKKMGLGVLEPSEAEVPVRVSETPTPTLPKPERFKQVRTHAPTISVTKAPAPLPVVLPTEQDIYTGDSYSPTIEDDDIEAGHGVYMRELDPERTSSSSARSPLSADPLDATRVPLPPSHATSPTHAVSQSGTVPLSDITDLLVDAGPAPSPKPPGAPMDAPLPAITVDDLADGVAVVAEEEESPQSVSLVGTSVASSSSDVPSSPTSTDDFENVDAASVPAAEAPDAASPNEAKRKSISQMLGTMGR